MNYPTTSLTPEETTLLSPLAVPSSPVDNRELASIAVTRQICPAVDSDMGFDPASLYVIPVGNGVNVRVYDNHPLFRSISNIQFARNQAALREQRDKMASKPLPSASKPSFLSQIKRQFQLLFC